MRLSSALVAIAACIITAEAGPLPKTDSDSSLTSSASAESRSSTEPQARASSSFITKTSSSSEHRSSATSSFEHRVESSSVSEDLSKIHTSESKATKSSSSAESSESVSHARSHEESSSTRTSEAKTTSSVHKDKTSSSSNDNWIGQDVSGAWGILTMAASKSLLIDPFAKTSTSAPVKSTSAPSSSAAPVITSAPATTQTSGIIGYPCTSTNTQNSAVTAFASCTTWSGGVQAMFSGSSTQVQSGISMQVTLVSTSSAYVGTLTDWNLYTSVSAALMTACSPSGLPASATKTSGQTSVPTWTSCGSVPTITGIVYSTGSAANMNQVQDYGGHDWFSDGTLQINVPEISFTDEQSLTAMVAGLASALNSSSMNWANYATTVGPYCDGLDGGDCNTVDMWSGPNCVTYQGMDAYGRQLDPVQPYPPDVATVPGFLQSILTIDTPAAPLWPVQFMSISLSTTEAEAGEFTCADGALITDGLGVLAFVPGLDFLSWMAFPALAVSATCAGEENAKGG